MSSSDKDVLNSERLGAINSKILAGGPTTEFPTVNVGGQNVRTGTIATLLHNIRLYDNSTDEAEKKTLAEEMRLTIPVLKKVGMFDLFTPQEWAADNTKSEARKLVGRMALEESK